MAQHSAPPKPKPAGGTSRTALLGWAAVGVVAVVAVVVAIGAFFGGAAAPLDAPATDGAAPVVDVADLTPSNTFTTIDGAPADPDPGGTTEGFVVNPIRNTPVHDGPGGAPLALMETGQFGDTWLPLIGEQDGWVQVLLPSKPASSTGWLRAEDVERLTTPYVIEVHLGSRTLELMRDGESVGEWSVGVGGPDTPTPTGRTFLLGAFSDEAQNYSPVILPLGTHSPTLDTYGGGPGTVAIHTWPTDDTFGEAVSDGCIRVPQDALDQLVEVPLGTLVMIDEG